MRDFIPGERLYTFGLDTTYWRWVTVPVRYVRTLSDGSIVARGRNGIEVAGTPKAYYKDRDDAVNALHHR